MYRAPFQILSPSWAEHGFETKRSTRGSPSCSEASEDPGFTSTLRVEKEGTQVAQA
jgi:hypothetical protein